MPALPCIVHRAATEGNTEKGLPGGGVVAAEHLVVAVEVHERLPVGQLRHLERGPLVLRLQPAAPPAPRQCKIQCLYKCNPLILCLQTAALPAPHQNKNQCNHKRRALVLRLQPAAPPAPDRHTTTGIHLVQGFATEDCEQLVMGASARAGWALAARLLRNSAARLHHSMQPWGSCSIADKEALQIIYLVYSRVPQHPHGPGTDSHGHEEDGRGRACARRQAGACPERRAAAGTPRRPGGTRRRRPRRPPAAAPAGAGPRRGARQGWMMRRRRRTRARRPARAAAAGSRVCRAPGAAPGRPPAAAAPCAAAPPARAGAARQEPSLASAPLPSKTLVPRCNP